MPHYYEVGVETEVIVDGSPVGIGAMLTQNKRNGHRPVAYIRKSLSLGLKTLQKFITTTTVEGSSWQMLLPDFLQVYRSTPHTVTGRSPYSQVFGGREMRGKIPQFSLSSEKDPEV